MRELRDRLREETFLAEVRRRQAGGYKLFARIRGRTAAPAALVALLSRERAVYMSAIVVLLFVSTGPINSAIVSVVAPIERARGVAQSILGIHLLGDVPSPPLIGALSEATSLGTAFLVSPAVIAPGGSICLYAAKRFWILDFGLRITRPGARSRI